MLNPHSTPILLAGEGVAEWLAFTGKAFLSTDAAALRVMLAELRPHPLPAAASARLLEDCEAALRGHAADLEAAYVRLFLDPAGAPCPPWQSAHSSDPQLMGEAHHSALNWYRTLGVEPKATNEPADHIGLLLTFAATLVSSGLDKETLERFYREHMAWMPAFCASVAREAGHPFYALLAEVTQQLLENAPFGPRIAHRTA